MPKASGPGRRPDPALSNAKYRQRAARYDLELLPFEPVRTEAIALLDVRTGDTVVDVGCGTGLSFGPLVGRVGAAGRIVGVDPSPEMMALARQRVAQRGWSGIALLEATAGEAPLQGRADAALFLFTHDVLRDPDALDHVIAHLKPGAHVVAAGLQWAPPWMLPANLFVLGAAMYSVTCMEGLEQPWTMLAKRLRDLKVQTRGFGGIYIVSGRVPGAAPAGESH
ncbi:methyltransferase domain-containing protein [Ramlibacter sp. USB13]|uniref:Methyltransferase domain-containing protein n=1 Tax=Ramlibacter cellulosilyticus TaxID=2764187 RepID=A0A923SER9_9BURK|nr:methyltransferase domain-containing protein [Ramlibacter cellulosilyticus]MBC5783222.1 methyltransferase domain-containing protein [Ramlibacter cellulosilyticus]